MSPKCSTSRLNAPAFAASRPGIWLGLARKRPEVRKSMAARKKAAKAGAVAAAPYVQRVISDEELRDNVRAAIESARDAFARLQNGKGPATTVLDDKKFHRNVSEAATAL